VRSLGVEKRDMKLLITIFQDEDGMIVSDCPGDS
jgi:hypothetical protein